MKNKKFLRVLTAITLSSVMAVGCWSATACDPTEPHSHTLSDWVKDDPDGHYKTCTGDGCTDPSGTKYEEGEHNETGTDGSCSVCGYKPAVTPPSHEHTYATAWTNDNAYHWHAATCEHSAEVSGKALHTFTGTKCTECNYEKTDPTELDADDLVEYQPVQNFEDETGTPDEVDAPKIIAKTGDGAALEEGEVDAVYEFDPATLSTKKYEDGWTNGFFTIGKGTEVRGRVKTGLYEGTTVIDATYVTVNSVKLGGSGDSLKIKAPAAGTFMFYVQNGSSGQTGTQTVVLTKPDKTTQNISYPADGSGSTIQRITLQLDAAGEYTISRTSGTSDIYYAKFTTKVNNTPIESITVANTGKVDYLVGQQLDCTEIAVNRVHAESGVVIPVNSANLTVDASAYNPNKEGTYTINISYTVESNLTSDTKTFTTSYDVNVYGYGDLSIGVDKIVQGPSSSAGNGTYVNHGFRQFYYVGDTFSTDGLSVCIVGKHGEDTMQFNLDASKATITGYDMNVAGVQTVKIAYTLNGVTKAKGLKIVVAEKPENIDAATDITLAVNKDFAEANVGKKNVYGAYRFRTIQQALEFLNGANMDENALKTIYLAEGTYWEKVEVNVPNVTMIGKGADKTKIEYDALYGETDLGGFVHTTDSTATLNIRDKAAGFTIKDVTVSNFYNCASAYEKASSNDHRALAMLIQADKVVVENCTLLGYQDTLELFTGRQYFKNCLIVGVTDYIFGTNNTTYFYQCEIRNINHEKQNQPGYVTAFKGNNKGTSTDKITYGAIFNDCDFTAEEGVPDGQCSMGRAWGADAAVMVMNSRIGKHISKTADTSSGGRYISMGNGDPKGAQFKEYNNTGDGAITESLATVEVITSADAAKNYSDFAVIFGKTNNLVTYTSAWNGSYGSVTTEKNYMFDDLEETGSITTEEGAPDEIYKGVFVAGTYRIQSSKSQAQFFAGTVITFKIKGQITLKFYGGDYGDDSNGRIVYKDGYATVYIVGTHNNIYITQITLDTAIIPVDTVERTVTVYDGDTVLTTIKINDGASVSEQEIKALLTGTAYEGKELDKVYTDSAKTAEYTFGAISADTSLYVTVKDKDTVVRQTISQNYTYTYDKNADAVESNEYVEFKGCAKNGDWLKYGGADSYIKFTVAAGATVTYTRSTYESGVVISINGVEQTDEDGGVVLYTLPDGGDVVITASGTAYLKSITVSFGDGTKKIGDVVDLTKITETYQGGKGTYDGVEIDATASGAKLGPNGSWPQFNKDTVLKIKVEAGATVQVTEYQNAGSITVSERDADGYITITATANTYISAITVVAAQAAE